MIGGDGVAAGAMATLQAQLPGVIAGLNAEPDAVQLAVPTVYALHGRHWPMPDLPVGEPVVKVSAPNVRVDGLDVATLAGDATAPLQVTVWAYLPPTGDGDLDHTTLMATLHRYGKAVVRVLAHEDTCCAGSTVTATDTAVRQADVSPGQPNPGYVMGAVAVVLQVEYVEQLAD